jgi:hypothetical protein
VNLRLAALNIIENDEPGRPPDRHRSQRQDAHLHVRAPHGCPHPGELLAVLIEDRRVIQWSVWPAQDCLGDDEPEPLRLVVKNMLPLDPAHDSLSEVGRGAGRA